MKIAVCFSGLIRTGCSCSTNLMGYFGEMAPYIDFFVHTWDFENQATPLADSISSGTPLWKNVKNYLPHKLQDSKVKKFLSIYNPKSYKIEPYNNFIDVNYAAINENRLISPLWVSFYNSIKLLTEYENNQGIKYDYIIKIRPDMIIKPGSKLINDINLLKTYTENSLLICNLGGEEQLSIESCFTDDVLFIGRRDIIMSVSKHGDSKNKTHEYFMRFLIENDIQPYNAITYSYTILRPHLLHLDTNIDYELIRKEEFLFYLPKTQYHNMYGNEE